MKITSIVGIILFTILSMSSCVEEIDIEYGKAGDFIIIDAIVTDYDKVQTVIIRRGRDMDIDIYTGPKLDTIENVTVKIADDLGWSGEFHDVSEGKGREFELEGHQFEPGRTYTLTVTVGEREFTSTETMPQPPIIDHLEFYSHPVKEDVLWSPILFFKDSQPDVDNYYLFTESSYWLRRSNVNQCLYVQALTDEGLRGDMEGVKISLGIGADSYTYSGIRYDEGYYYELYTVNKCIYDYFEVIKDQLTSDGGVYKPTPTTPVTNISGEYVQGLFIMASKNVLYGKTIF